MKALLVVAVAILFALMIVYAPLVTIWSLNTLFHLGIAYTFQTWFAVIWILAVTFGGIKVSSKTE